MSDDEEEGDLQVWSSDDGVVICFGEHELFMEAEIAAQFADGIHAAVEFGRVKNRKRKS